MLTVSQSSNNLTSLPFCTQTGLPEGVDYQRISSTFIRALIDCEKQQFSQDIATIRQKWTRVTSHIHGGEGADLVRSASAGYGIIQLVELVFSMSLGMPTGLAISALIFTKLSGKRDLENRRICKEFLNALISRALNRIERFDELNQKLLQRKNTLMERREPLDLRLTSYGEKLSSNDPESLYETLADILDRNFLPSELRQRVEQFRKDLSERFCKQKELEEKVQTSGKKAVGMYKSLQHDLLELKRQDRPGCPVLLTASSNPLVRGVSMMFHLFVNQNISDQNLEIPETWKDELGELAKVLKNSRSSFEGILRREDWVYVSCPSDEVEFEITQLEIEPLFKNFRQRLLAHLDTEARIADFRERLSQLQRSVSDDIFQKLLVTVGDYAELGKAYVNHDFSKNPLRLYQFLLPPMNLFGADAFFSEPEPSLGEADFKLKTALAELLIDFALGDNQGEALELTRLILKGLKDLNAFHKISMRIYRSLASLYTLQSVLRAHKDLEIRLEGCFSELQGTMKELQSFRQDIFHNMPEFRERADIIREIEELIPFQNGCQEIHELMRRNMDALSQGTSVTLGRYHFRIESPQPSLFCVRSVEYTPQGNFKYIDS